MFEQRNTVLEHLALLTRVGLFSPVKERSLTFLSKAHIQSMLLLFYLLESLIETDDCLLKGRYRHNSQGILQATRTVYLSSLALYMYTTPCLQSRNAVTLMTGKEIPLLYPLGLGRWGDNSKVYLFNLFLL